MSRPFLPLLLGLALLPSMAVANSPAEAEALLKDRDGNLTKLNHDNV